MKLQYVKETRVKRSIRPNTFNIHLLGRVTIQRFLERQTR